MTVPDSVLLGGLQGIAEFLPVSGSAHLIAAPWLVKAKHGAAGAANLDVLLHFGALLAVLTVYGKRFVTILVEGIVDMSAGKFRDVMLTKIVLAALPAAALSLLNLSDKFFTEARPWTNTVAVISLVAVAALMFAAERIEANGKRITVAVVVAAGIAQAAALMPGVSRIGMTIAVAMMCGLKRGIAVDFSLLLSIPVILGMTLYESMHFRYDANEVFLYLSGAVSAFVFGLLSLTFLMRYLKRRSLDLFALYGTCLAAIIFFLC